MLPPSWREILSADGNRRQSSHTVTCIEEALRPADLTSTKLEMLRCGECPQCESCTAEIELGSKGRFGPFVNVMGKGSSQNAAPCTFCKKGGMRQLATICPNDRSAGQKRTFKLKHLGANNPQRERCRSSQVAFSNKDPAIAPGPFTHSGSVFRPTSKRACHAIAPRSATP